MQDERGWMARRVVGWVFFVTTVYAVFAVLELTVFRVTGSGGVHSVGAGVVAAVLLVLIVVAEHDLFAELAGRLGERLARAADRRWLLGCIATGWLLRLAWCGVVRPVQAGNSREFLGLAASLAGRGVFEFEGITVYLPPGLPLLLAPSVKLLGASAWVPLLNNLLFFAVTVLAVHALARRLVGRPGARLATALLVAWPNTVMLSGTAAKELAALPLLTLAVLVYLRAGEADEGTGWRTALGGGALLGGTILVQPASAVLLPAFVGYEIVARRGRRRAVARVAVLAAGAVLVVAPWTIRNALRFHAFVPVSANAGTSLYVGNNPVATGGHVKVPGDWEDLDELTVDRRRRRLAVEWIRANPGRFVELVFAKQILFLGDDADGAWESLKRTYGINDLRFIAAKGVCNVYWLGVLALLALATWRQLRGRFGVDAAVQLLMLLFLCLVVLLSVTESGGRHHIALSGFAAVLAGFLAEGAGAER